MYIVDYSRISKTDPQWKIGNLQYRQKPVHRHRAQRSQITVFSHTATCSCRKCQVDVTKRGCDVDNGCEHSKPGAGAFLSNAASFSRAASAGHIGRRVTAVTTRTRRAGCVRACITDVTGAPDPGLLDPRSPALSSSRHASLTSPESQGQHSLIT